MLTNSGDSTPAAVFVDPSVRRRRAFRVALVAVALGWAAVIALMIIGLTSAPDAPRTVLAGTPEHRPAHHAAHGTSHAAHRNSQAARMASETSSAGLSKSARQMLHAPRACLSGSKCANGGCRRSRIAVTALTFGSVRSAFNGIGVAPPTDKSAGNFDCHGFSFQAKQLAATGFGPGDTVAIAGQMMTLPDAAQGAPDEIIAEGQVIRLSPTGRRAAELGFLGAGEFGTQTGTVTVTYVDGSTRKVTLRLADWYADVPVAGSVIAASALWNVPAGQTSAYGPAPVSVYYTQIPVDAAKPIASVTLPRNADLHFFDIGVPAPAHYLSVSSARNDIGLAPASAADQGNYDGDGHSYDSGSLAAKGLKPGASVTAQGVTFTWPRPAPGRFDNIRAQGQTIRIAGTGRVLGFLGAASFGTQRATVTIHYTDGTSATAILSFADWLAGQAAGGGTTVATVPWNRVPGAGQHQVSVYSAAVPLRAGKTVASVTLPVDINMHVFAIAVGR